MEQSVSPTSDWSLRGSEYKIHQRPSIERTPENMKRHPTAKPRLRSLRMELLESRFAPAYGAVFAAGILTITSGDATNDSIVVDDVNSNGVIDVAGSDVLGATLSTTTGMVFSNAGGAGRDTVVLAQGNNGTAFDTIPVTINSGNSGDGFDLRNM